MLIWLMRPVALEAERVGIVKQIIEVNDEAVARRDLKVEVMGESHIVSNYETSVRYAVGERVLLEQSEYGPILAGKERTQKLKELLVLFVVTILLATGTRGIRPLIGLGVSFLVIFYYVLPTIAAGGDPITTTLLACVAIVGIGFYTTHGVTMKTSLAVIGSLGSLAVIALLAQYYGMATGLTGYGSEEVSFLQTELGSKLRVYPLLIAGFIIGALGVLDDVTISQVSVVAEVSRANNKLTKWEIYRRAMRVGHDHIASMVNTLVLVYAGVSLPLLLLFVAGGKDWITLINYEPVTEEIIRTLVSSIGLVTSVPITTLLAAHWYSRKANP